MTTFNPDYYCSNGVKVIDFIDAYNLSFSLGNVVKYIARAGHKQGEDKLTALHKAYFYLLHEMAIEEKHNQ